MATKVELLKAFKKMNLSVREKKAKSLGYANAAAYMAYLTSKGPKAKVEKGKSKAKTTVRKVKEKDIIVHHVDIIDKSGSMTVNGKYDKACDAVVEGVQSLSKLKNCKYSLFMFSDNSVSCLSLKEDPSKCSLIFPGAKGLTNLNDTIGSVFTAFKSEINKENVEILITVYTDGEENSSVKYTAAKIKDLIAESKNVTVAFVGTKGEVNRVVKEYGISKTNTLTYDGESSSELYKTMRLTTELRSKFTSSVRKGNLEMKKSFYTK